LGTFPKYLINYSQHLSSSWRLCMCNAEDASGI